MYHDLQKTVSYDIENCTSCVASLLCGTDMFECTFCADKWNYRVDCKRAPDLRPSHNQRQHNAQARALGRVLYQSTPTKQPSERHVLDSIVQDVATRLVNITGDSMQHARNDVRHFSFCIRIRNISESIRDSANGAPRD